MRRFLCTIVLAAIVFAGLPAAAQFSEPRRSESIVSIAGENYWIHTVGADEDLRSLAKLYDTDEETITDNNIIGPDGVTQGQVLKIPVETKKIKPRQQTKLFDEHIVSAGETSYSIARNYGISLTTLVADNAGIDPTLLSIGQTLLIRKKQQGETETWELDEQWADYRDAANKISDGFIYHIVQPGETIYGLSKEYFVSQDTLVSLNQLHNGLKALSMIRIPVVGAEKTPETAAFAVDSLISEGVRPADSLAVGIPFSQSWEGAPNIALLLPLEGTTGAGNDFVEFYRGVLIALEELKAAGRSTNVTIYDTARSADKVFDVVTLPEFSQTNLVIGPVYEDEIDAALQFAAVYGAPVVSPLATITEADSELLYQMAPDASTKYDKLGDLFSPDNNIVLISSGEEKDADGKTIVLDDKNFEEEIVAKLDTLPYRRFTITRSTTLGETLSRYIDWGRKNVFVVLGGTEVDVNKALASLGTAYNSASARHGRRKPDINVVGSSRWAGFSDAVIDKSLFFKLGVCFVTSYYVDRLEGDAARFKSRFLGAYGEFPSRAAYRGYDAVAMFVGALFRSEYSFEDRVKAMNPTPLQTPYNFVQLDGQKRRTNIDWTLVRFDDNYRVEVK